MYKAKYLKSKLHSSDKIAENFPQNVQVRNPSDVFQDVRIQHQSIQSPSFQIYQLNQYSKKSDVIQRKLESELSDISQEVTFRYTGILSQHPNYHGGGGIKASLLKTIGAKNLSRLLKKKGQKNFDFYMCRGQQVWVADNGSTKPEKDTGYDIIFVSETSYEIVKRDSASA